MTDQIDRTVLPIRRPPFQGVTNRTLGGSEPDWNFVAPIPAPEGAPNVLLVMTDDAGFGNPSTFGGPISTPTLDRLAAEGLRYNRFHTTALCSAGETDIARGDWHRPAVTRPIDVFEVYAGSWLETRTLTPRTREEYRAAWLVE
jgi:Sulfatase